MDAEFQKKSPDMTSVSLTLVGFGMRPEAVTESFGIRPTQTDVGFVRDCGRGRKEECGLWSWDTAQSVSTGELAEHIEHLVSVFRPLKSRMEEIRPRPNVFVNVRCGPIGRVGVFRTPRIEARHVAAIAELGAALTVEIVQ